MNLNNNWSRNVDTGKWTSASDVLKKSDFDALAQDVKTYRFYQKCLSGSTYVGINTPITGSGSLNNVYDILNISATPSSYYFDYLGTSPLNYVQPFIGTFPMNPSQIISTSSLASWTDRILPEYNHTLKNLFTPERLIKDQKENLFYVDVATTTILDNLGQVVPNLVIDDVIIKEGHRVLVKDQITKVSIPTSTNPDNFFFGYYEVDSVVGTITTYRIPTSDNGIYIYKNRKLERTTELDTYEDILRYSICVKLGTTNRETQFKLSRLRTGFFPQWNSGILYPGGPTGDSMYFQLSHNYVLRQRVDYNNLFELSLQDTLKHATQSLIVEKLIGTVSGTFSYTIPERTLTVGEFGVIINDQEGITNIINSKYKTTLRSITETSRYYWICGDEGLLLKVDKTDFTIEKVSLKYPSGANQPSDSVITRLTSVNFFNDLRGVVVGFYNQIWVTSDTGQTWTQIYLPDFDGFNYNKIVFATIDKFYVGGDNGVFIEFSYNLGDWFAYKRRISKYLDYLDDEYLLVDDIIDMTYFNVGTNSFVAIGCELNNLYLYDINNFISSTWSFLYLQDTLNTTNNFGDISGITWVSSTSSLYFSTFEHIYQVDPLSGFFGLSNSNVFSTTFSIAVTQSAINAITEFNNQELIYTGNFSLWQKWNFSATSSVYDPTYFPRLKPRLLFMDYDIGSKLYWFDDYGQYRIPERYGITVSLLQNTSNNTHIGFNPNTNTVYNGITPINYLETNWIEYFRDRQKTFEYYTNLEQAYVVKPSFTFSSSDACGKTFSYATPSVTTDYLDIVGLMPSATPPMQISSLTQSSRFREIPGVPITLATSPYNLYFYDYLGIWVENFNYGDIIPEVGDVLNISSDEFDGRFIINKIATTSSVSGGTRAIARIGLSVKSFPLASGVVTPPPQYAGTFSLSCAGIPISGTISIRGGIPNGTINGTILPGTQSLPTTLLAAQNNILNFIAGQINASGTGFNAFASSTQLTIQAPMGSVYNGLAYLPIISYTATDVNSLQWIGARSFVGGSDPTGTITGYFYFYTDFNENILNNISYSTSGFTVRDLNKYPLQNTSDNNQYFVDNFNKHYISYSYDCEQLLDNTLGTQSFRITPKYSQWSAYYNLQSTVDVVDNTGNNYSNEIKYASGFLNFGYSPTFNLLSYLNFIDPNEFIPSKEFYAMSNRIGVPGPQLVPNDIPNQIFIDIGTFSPYSPSSFFEDNKLRIGENLKYIWDSLLKWTFVDVKLTDLNGNIKTTERLLITDKYVTQATGTTYKWYVIEFHDRFEYNPLLDIYYVDIISRRTLQQVSDDLQYINRLHRPDWLVSESWNTSSTGVSGTWSNYETQIDFKVPTDSYSKILLSDYAIIKNLSGILYTDYKYELAMQVTKLDREFEFNLINVTSDLVTGNYQFDFTQPHQLETNDWIIVTSNNPQMTFSPSILGYHSVIVVNPYSIVIPIFASSYGIASDLKVSFVKKDYFLNFQPIDIFDLGIGDKLIKQSVEITTEQWDIVGSSYNLINLDLNKYKFRLVDGLDLVSLNANYSWLLEAEISNAIIGMDSDKNLVWYKGIWYCGRWFGGNWISGAWLSGDWYYGNWTSKSTTDNLLSVRIDNQTTTEDKSIWYDGRWFDGSWENGTWYNGRWYGGTWSNGRWFDGIWNDGLWENGKFHSGIWVLGQWNNGIFNTDNGPAFWLDGKFYGGDFENGVWYNGIFDEKNSKKSRFGTKSNNSRMSIWKSGKFLSGQFHSYLNLDDNGNPDVSDVHKYSRWYTGFFGGGDFYGGLSYNINFKNTTWHGGISEDIEVTKVTATANSFTLNGEFNFNVNDEIYILDNQNYSTFSVYGSTDNPKLYKVLFADYDSVNKVTDVYVDLNLQTAAVGNTLLDGTWKVISLQTNYPIPPGILTTYLAYFDIASSGNSFSELVDSTLFIYNGTVNYSQTNTVPAPPIVSSYQFTTTYNNSQIDLTPFISVLSPNPSIFDITFGINALTATLSLTQDPVTNPTGIIIEYAIEKIPITGSVSNLRCVSNFDNSTWNSGLWYNGVFKDGIFNGGLWYNGYFQGTWG